MLDTEKLKDIFRDYPYIASAYLFGSHAKGRTGSMSDVDIAVLYKDSAPKGRDLIHAEGYLSYRIAKMLGVEEVDLINLRKQKLVFQHNVLRSGKLIYDADPDFRIKFVMHVILYYCDFEPTLRFMRKYSYKGRLRRLAKL